MAQKPYFWGRNDAGIHWANPSAMQFQVGRTTQFDQFKTQNVSLEALLNQVNSEFSREAADKNLTRPRLWQMESSMEQGRRVALLRYRGWMTGQEGKQVSKPQVMNVYALYQGNGVTGVADYGLTSVQLFTGSINASKTGEDQFSVDEYRPSGSTFMDWLRNPYKKDVAYEGRGKTFERRDINDLTPQALAGIGGMIGIPTNISGIVPHEAKHQFSEFFSKLLGTPYAPARASGAIQSVQAYTGVTPSVVDSVKDIQRQGQRKAHSYVTSISASPLVEQAPMEFLGGGKREGNPMWTMYVDDPIFLGEGAGLVRQGIGTVKHATNMLVGGSDPNERPSIHVGDYWGSQDTASTMGYNFRGEVGGLVPDSKYDMGNNAEIYINDVTYNKKAKHWIANIFAGNPAETAEWKSSLGSKMMGQGVSPEHFAMQAAYATFGRMPHLIGAFPQKPGRTTNLAMEIFSQNTPQKSVVGRGEELEREAMDYVNQQWRTMTIPEMPVNDYQLALIRERLGDKAFREKFKGGFRIDEESGQKYALNYELRAMMTQINQAPIAKTTSGIHTMSAAQLNIAANNQPAFFNQIQQQMQRGAFSNKQRRILQALELNRGNEIAGASITDVSDINLQGYMADIQRGKTATYEQMADAVQAASADFGRSFVKVGGNVLPTLHDIGSMITRNSQGKVDKGLSTDLLRALFMGETQQALGALTGLASEKGFRTKALSINVPAFTGSSNAVPFLNADHVVARSEDVVQMLQRMKLSKKEKGAAIDRWLKTGTMEGVGYMQQSDEVNAYQGVTFLSQGRAQEIYGKQIGNYHLTPGEVMASSVYVAGQNKDADGDPWAFMLMPGAQSINRPSVRKALLGTGGELQSIVDKTTEGPDKIRGFFSNYKRGKLSTLASKQQAMAEQSYATEQMGLSFDPFVESQGRFSKLIENQVDLGTEQFSALRSSAMRVGNDVYQRAMDIKPSKDPSSQWIQKAFYQDKLYDRTDQGNVVRDPTSLARMMFDKLGVHGMHPADVETNAQSYLGAAGLSRNHAMLLAQMGYADNDDYIDRIQAALEQNFLGMSGDTMNDDQRSRLLSAITGVTDPTLHDKALRSLMLGEGDGVNTMSFGSAHLFGAMAANTEDRMMGKVGTAYENTALNTLRPLMSQAKIARKARKGQLDTRSLRGLVGTFADSDDAFSGLNLMLNKLFNADSRQTKALDYLNRRKTADSELYGPGYERGGYTGQGNPMEPRGIVHADEVVLNRFDVQDIREGKGSKVIDKVEDRLNSPGSGAPALGSVTGSWPGSSAGMPEPPYWSSGEVRYGEYWEPAEDAWATAAAAAGVPDDEIAEALRRVGRRDPGGPIAKRRGVLSGAGGPISAYPPGMTPPSVTPPAMPSPAVYSVPGGGSPLSSGGLPFSPPSTAPSTRKRSPKPPYSMTPPPGTPGPRGRSKPLGRNKVMRKLKGGSFQEQFVDDISLGYLDTKYLTPVQVGDLTAYQEFLAANTTELSAAVVGAGTGDQEALGQLANFVDAFNTIGSNVDKPQAYLDSLGMGTSGVPYYSEAAINEASQVFTEQSKITGVRPKSIFQIQEEKRKAAEKAASPRGIASGVRASTVRAPMDIINDANAVMGGGNDRQALHRLGLDRAALNAGATLDPITQRALSKAEVYADTQGLKPQSPEQYAASQTKQYGNQHLVEGTTQTSVALLKEFSKEMGDLGESIKKAKDGSPVFIKHLQTMADVFDQIDAHAQKIDTLKTAGVGLTAEDQRFETQVLNAKSFGGKSFRDLQADATLNGQLAGARQTALSYWADQQIAPRMDYDEQQAQLVGLIGQGGRGGQIRRANPKNDWMYTEGLDLGAFGKIEGQENINKYGSAMRLAGGMNKAMWASGHLQWQVIQPMMEQGNFYRDQMLQQGQALAQTAGGYGYADFMNSTAGAAAVQRGNSYQYQMAQGRQIQQAYPILFGGGGGQAGSLMGAGQAIGAPALASMVVANQLGAGAAAAAPMIGAGVAAAAALNFMYQGTVDTTGMIAGQARMANDYRNIVASGGHGYDITGSIANNIGGAAGLAWNAVTDFLHPGYYGSLLQSGQALADVKGYFQNGVTAGKEPNSLIGLRGGQNDAFREIAAKNNVPLGQVVSGGFQEYIDLHPEVSPQLAQDVFGYTQMANVARGTTMDRWLTEQAALGMSPGQSIQQGAIAQFGYLSADTLSQTGERYRSFVDRQTQSGVSRELAEQYWVGSNNRAASVNVGRRMAGLPEVNFDQYAQNPAAADVMSRRSGLEEQLAMTSPTLYRALSKTISASGVQSWSTPQEIYQANQRQDAISQGLQTGLKAFTTYGASAQTVTQWTDYLTTLAPEQRQLAVALQSGDRLAQSQNYQRMGSFDYYTMNPNTGMGAYYESTDPNLWARARKDDVNRATGQSLGLFRLSDEEARGGERQWSANITLKGEEEQTRQYNLDVAQREMQYGITTGDLQTTRQYAAQYGYNFNVGNGMGTWQIENQQRSIQRQQTWFGLGQEQQSLNLQQQQFNLAASQFQESYNLNKQSFTVNRTYNQAMMNLNREEQVTGFQWSQQDLDVNRNKSALQFGWDMQDYDRNIRYARGREKLDLMRNKGREVITRSIDVGQEDRQQERLTQQEKWAEEEFNLKKKNFDQTNKLQLQQMELEKKHWEQNRQFEQQRMQMAQQAHDKNVEWTKQEQSLQDQQRLLDREALKMNYQITVQNAAASRDAQLYVNKFRDAISSTGESLAASLAKINVEATKLANTAQVMGTGTAPSKASGTGSSSGNSSPTTSPTPTTTTYGPNPVPANQNTAPTWNWGGTDWGSLLGYAEGGPVYPTPSATRNNVPAHRAFSNVRGYTGDGAKAQPVGIVHKGEWVVPQGGALVSNNPEVTELLKQIHTVLKNILALGPGRVSAVISTNEKQVKTSDLLAAVYGKLS